MSLERPPISINIKLDGEDKTVKLTYGLFLDLNSVIPDPENIGELLVSDPGLRDYILRRILTEKKRIKDEEDLIDLHEHDISLDDVQKLVVWAGDHILYFFTTSMTSGVALGEKYQDTILQLVQSKNGSEDSTSTD